MSRHSWMHAEAASAHEAVSRQLEQNETVVIRLCEALAADPPPFAITCARGSSDHVATFLKYVFETRLGLLTASFAPSVESVYARPLSVGRAVCFMISQSGRSPDLLAVARRVRSDGARLVALVNDEASPLADLAEFVIPLRAGTEQSVAATKSVLAGLFAVLSIAQRLAPDRLSDCDLQGVPSLLRHAWALDWSALSRGLLDAPSLFTIGRGPGLAVAAEAALKFKETCGLHAECFSAAEVRHGPLALIGERFPLLLFAQNDETAPGLAELARDAVARGCPVFVAGLAIDGTTHLPAMEAAPLVEPLLQLQSFYGAANALSLARGFDPDCPPLLKKVTQTV